MRISWRLINQTECISGLICVRKISLHCEVRAQTFSSVCTESGFSGISNKYRFRFPPLQTDKRRMSIQAPYGTWKSPVTSQVATEKCVSFSDLSVDKTKPNGGVFWNEQRPAEGGRYVVSTLNDISWTPQGYNARTLVHEYGGAAFMAHGGTVYFSNFETQELNRQTSADGKPESITPGDKGWRYADGCFSDKHQKLYYVREDHGVIKSEGKKQPVNTVVVIDPNTKQQNILTEGCDFYSSPRVSPDGSRLAWMQWVHPNMPWDTTELWVAELDSSGSAFLPNSAQKVAGGGDTSVMYPRWTNDNRLLYIGDQTEWWNLYLVDESGDHINLHPVDKELGGPHWQFATNAYDVDPSGSGSVVTAYGGLLGILNHNDKSYREISTGYESHRLVQFGADGNIYCVAASPTRFSEVIRVDPRTDKVEVVKKSREVTVDDAYFSIPSSITWSAKEGHLCHGYLYMPKNKDYTAPSGELPPLLVRAHGGPTAQSGNNLNLAVQYFTSRGFALLDTNYRGSTGYGKTYRHKLRTNWGVSDVEDCCSGAQYLADSGQVDKNRLCIDGGSAGGYTTLACLAFKDVFRAGASRYGIGDVEVLMQDTHKFESRYCDMLICEYTKENLPIIHARSPIKHIDNFSCPIVFFQGDEDKIVPPNQAQMMFEAVKEKGIPCAFVLFEGEQHGFRKAENIQLALDGEFYFFAKVFGYEPADNVGQLPIYNLEQQKK